MGLPVEPSALDISNWQNAIFAAPLAGSAVLLILSSLRFGSHHALQHHVGGPHGGAMNPGALGSHGAAASPVVGGGHAPAAGHGDSSGSQANGHSAHIPHLNGSHGAVNAARHAASNVGKQAAAAAQEGADAIQAASAPLPPTHMQPPVIAFISSLFHLGGAPVLMVLELFLIAWGFLGLVTNEYLIEHGHAGAFGVIALSVPIALFGGLVIARLGAALMNRVLPREETSVTSHDNLFGLTGEITYEVTTSGGRIHVYDAYGTLHDEACRALEGRAPIKKGAVAMVEDIDAKGNLIVREVAG